MPVGGKKQRPGPESATDSGPGPVDPAPDAAIGSKTDSTIDEQQALIEQHEAEVAENQAASSRRFEQVVALSLVLLSLLGVYGSQTITLRNHVSEAFGPRWWPTALCLISLVLSVALTVISFTRPPFEREGIETSTRAGWYRAIVTVVLEFLFIVAWMWSGNFFIPTIVMLAAMLWFYGTRSWKMLIAFPVLTAGVIYLLFDLLLKLPL